MKRQLSIPALVLTVALAAAPAHADVKKEERNQVSFAGMLGKVFNFFGGKSAKEGVVSTVAVSGDRKMTTTGENTGQIVDLREEKIYDLDLRRKTYKVTTFEEIRRQMREAEAKARESAAKRAERRAAGEERGQGDGGRLRRQEHRPDEGDQRLRHAPGGRHDHRPRKGQDDRGQRRHRHDRRHMAEQAAPSLKEIADFERRYCEKLAGPISAVDAQQMATAMAMFPGVKEAFARFSREDLGGTAIQTTTTMDAVKSAEQMKQEAAGGSSASSDDKANPRVDRRRDRRLHAPAPAAAREGSRREAERQPGALDVHDDEQRSAEDRDERHGGRRRDAGGV